MAHRIYAPSRGASRCSLSRFWPGDELTEYYYVCGVNVSSRDKLDDLLARGRLSAPRRERIFEEVDRQVRGGTRGRAKYLIVMGPLALAAALALVLRPHSDERGGYAAKGAGAANLDIGCSGGELSHCPRGSKLIFRFDPLPAAGFLHAFAEPLEPGQERVWYYPTAVNAPPRLEAALEGQVLDRAIVIGPEHAPGRYRVHIVFASTPLSRDEVLASSTSKVIASEVVEMVIVQP
jgi:hypothetical protein